MSYKSSIKTVSGKKGPKIFLFTLSTCVWCKKTKALFKDLGVNYSYVDVDLLEGSNQDEAVNEMGKYSPSTSFPTILIDKEVILGFDPEKINQVLNNGK